MNAAAEQPARMVYVVDDDDAVRDSLAMLFRTAGLRVETFDSAVSFLQRRKRAVTGCLVLDIRMPGLSGTALQEELVESGSKLPIIFITGHGDIPMAVEAVKKGAFDFIEKPFNDGRLLCQVLNALEQGGEGGGAAKRKGRDADKAAHGERLAQLTEREREVLDLVLAGKPNRQVAAELFISVKTVEFHRARIMQKLNVRSAAELFRLCLAGLQA
jgi:two-component system response regulator TtrR